MAPQSGWNSIQNDDRHDSLPYDVPPGTTGGSSRIRGKHGPNSCLITFPSGHPRIRGVHAVGVQVAFVRVRIIPAYAGSTGVRSRSSSVTTDHLRTRGHSRIRGKHLRFADGDRVVVRIIPAYAGSTMGQNSLLTTAFSLVELRSTGIHAARRHHERTRKLGWRRSPLARRPGTARSAGDPVRAPTAERGSHDANVAQQRLDRPNSGRRLRRCACRK